MTRPPRPATRRCSSLRCRDSCPGWRPPARPCARCRSATWARSPMRSCFHQVFLAPPNEVGLAPPRQFQLLLAPPRWSRNLLQLPWQSPLPRCQWPLGAGPELLRRRSWWGRKNLERWGRNKFAESRSRRCWPGSCPARRHSSAVTPRLSRRAPNGDMSYARRPWRGGGTRQSHKDMSTWLPGPTSGAARYALESRPSHSSTTCPAITPDPTYRRRMNRLPSWIRRSGMSWIS